MAICYTIAAIYNIKYKVTMTNFIKTVAVFWGGRSPEHDVSIVTGLQAFQAIDRSQYLPFAVYIDPIGRWWVGKGLEKRDTYLLTPEFCRSHLTQVTLDLTANAPRPRLIAVGKKGLFCAKPKTFEFDVALLAFHGLYGEDGAIQGALALANVPHTGAGVRPSAMMMSKSATKEALDGTGIPLLPHTVIRRPGQRLLLTADELKEATHDMVFPVIVKPNHLGSSIGVAKANTTEELNAVLPAVFKYDDAAIIEPFVENLCEYNLAVMRNTQGEVCTSAIERPKRSDALLDFKQKYLSGGDNKTGSKIAGAEASQGMLSLTRDINPKDLSKKQIQDLQHWAKTAFDVLDAAGSPRIDFLCNAKTGEMWLNEINPIPGSFGYFLWEAAPENPLLFTELLNTLLSQAQQQHARRQLPPDPTPEDARLFKRS